MRRFSKFCAATALVSLLCVSGNALGDAPDEDKARVLFREGLSLHQAHNYTAALEKFRAAYRLWKNPKILANIGTAAWELGRYAIAANAYDRFLEEAPADAPNRGEVEKALKEVLPRVGTLAIQVTGSPKTVTIDGQQVEVSRVRRVRVMPGRHDVAAVAENGSHAEQSVSVGAGATVTLELSLESSEPQKSAAKPTTEEKPTPTHPGAAPQRSALPWVVGGIGAASLVTSAVLFTMKGSTESQLKGECIGKVCPDSSKDKIAKANRLGAFGMITLGIGVAGVGTAVYLIAKGPSKEAPAEHQALELFVSGSRGSASATFAGRF